MNNMKYTKTLLVGAFFAFIFFASASLPSNAVSAQTCANRCLEVAVDCKTTPGDACCIDDPNNPGQKISCAQVIRVDRPAIGFQIPGFSEVLTFLIRFFFVLAGLTALLYMLWGAYDYVSSGGDDKKTGSAQKKITAALIGVFLIVVALMLIVTLEQVIFRKTICFGVSCPAQLPDLLKPCRDVAPVDGVCD